MLVILKKLFLILKKPIIGLALFLSLILLSGCTKQTKVDDLVPSSSAGNSFFSSSPENIDLETNKKEVNMTKKTQLQPPGIEIDANKKYTAVLSTDLGDIAIALNADQTPITVNNFVYLSRQDFYNNTIFHRVIKGFMIQGGDPNGDGTGGPGYKFKDEPIVGDYQRGTVAMANSGPDTNGSQFFIIHQDYDLPKNYVIFGQVIQGMEVVDKIAVAQVGPSSGGENSKPLNPVVIKSVEILEE